MKMYNHVATKLRIKMFSIFAQGYIYLSMDFMRLSNSMRAWFNIKRGGGGIRVFVRAGGRPSYSCPIWLKIDMVAPYNIFYPYFIF